VSADSPDEAAERLEQYSQEAWELFGIEDCPDAVINYGRNYANAFFDGTYLVFGTGDGKIYGDFTKSRDVYAHEFGHFLVSRGPNLVYRAQSGALNEHVSDVFGVCLQQKFSGNPHDWKMGQEVFLDGTTCVRDMLNPGTAYDSPTMGKDPQPAHMRDYVEGSFDDGGVHINSGIPNRAFALLCETTGEESWGRPLAMWRKALADMTPYASFRDMAYRTWYHSGGGHMGPAVKDAWAEVGVTF
jgi:Zn-dependent metalloprotease